jgi:hypothetical protein
LQEQQQQRQQLQLLKAAVRMLRQVQGLGSSEILQDAEVEQALVLLLLLLLRLCGRLLMAETARQHHCWSMSCKARWVWWYLLVPISGRACGSTQTM